MLDQPGGWDTDNPQIRPGIEPRVATAVRVQQRLARQLVAYRQTNKLTKQELAERLHMSRAQLWRLVDGHAPITLLHSCAWAELLGLDSLDLG
jgi:Helix-turn-helix domain